MKLLKIYTEVLKDILSDKPLKVKIYPKSDYLKVICAPYTVVYCVPKDSFPFDLNSKRLSEGVSETGSILPNNVVVDSQKATIVGYDMRTVDAKEYLVALLKVNPDDEKERPVMVNKDLLKNFDKDAELRIVNEYDRIHPVGVFEKNTSGDYALAGLVLPIMR
jgi:hypothetical protein|nr:MAG TPA: hypothetical protein [Caudoviricetes sp.]